MARILSSAFPAGGSGGGSCTVSGVGATGGGSAVEFVNQKSRLRSTRGALNIDIFILPNRDVLADRNGTLFYKTLKNATLLEFGFTLDRSWHKQEHMVKKRLLLNLKRDFGEGWSEKKALQQAGRSLKRVRDHVRRKVMKLPEAQRSSAAMRPNDVDKKVWKILKKVAEAEKRQQQGIESLQEKAVRSRLAKLGISFSHRSGSGGGKHVDAQFVEEFNRFPDHEERQYGITHGFWALREMTIARMGTSTGGGLSSHASQQCEDDVDEENMTYDQLVAALEPGANTSGDPDDDPQTRHSSPGPSLTRESSGETDTAHPDQSRSACSSESSSSGLDRGSGGEQSGDGSDDEEIDVES